MFFLELPFSVWHIHFRKEGRGGGHILCLKKIYRPCVIFKVLGPPCHTLTLHSPNPWCLNNAHLQWPSPLKLQSNTQQYPEPPRWIHIPQLREGWQTWVLLSRCPLVICLALDHVITSTCPSPFYSWLLFEHYAPSKTSKYLIHPSEWPFHLSFPFLAAHWCPTQVLHIKFYHRSIQQHTYLWIGLGPGVGSWWS